MKYVTVAVYAVPTENKAAFIEHSKQLSPIFKKYGALSVVDCWGDDVSDGEVTSFPMAVKCEPNETVGYSHIIWPNKATHDANMENVMTDMEAASEHSPMPFDGKRMIFANFNMVVEL